MNDTVKPGQVFDLAVRFGSQLRYKCAFCSKFFAVRDDHCHCGCGAVYSRVRNGLFELQHLPTPPGSQTVQKWSSALETAFGGVYDMSVRFGNQVRYKCVVCKQRYIADKQRTQCKCGAVYLRLPNNEFELIGAVEGSPSTRLISGYRPTGRQKPTGSDTP